MQGVCLSDPMLPAAHVFRFQPASTPYAQGTFDLAVDFPIEYPFKGPKVRFLTPVYHPNIDNDGNICIGVLKSEAWKPSTKAITCRCQRLSVKRDTHLLEQF